MEIIKHFHFPLSAEFSSVQPYHSTLEWLNSTDIESITIAFTVIAYTTITIVKTQTYNILYNIQLYSIKYAK